jgi:hypothetical protein
MLEVDAITGFIGRNEDHSIGNATRGIFRDNLFYYYLTGYRFFVLRVVSSLLLLQDSRRTNIVTM